jgi:hypothetical protein
MVLSSIGQVGIGTATPANALDVVGNINASTGYKISGVAGETTTVIYVKNVVGSVVTFGTLTFAGGIETSHI